MKMTHLEKKIIELWKEFIDKEYLNMPVKVFCEKYQICYETCIKIMWKKERWPYLKRWMSYKEPVITPIVEKQIIKEHTYKIVGEFVEKSYIKWVFLSKNSGYTIQH